jgi:hypothetical protein
MALRKNTPLCSIILELVFQYFDGPFQLVDFFFLPSYSGRGPPAVEYHQNG